MSDQTYVYSVYVSLLFTSNSLSVSSVYNLNNAGQLELTDKCWPFYFTFLLPLPLVPTTREQLSCWTLLFFPCPAKPLNLLRVFYTTLWTTQLISVAQLLRQSCWRSNDLPAVGQSLPSVAFTNLTHTYLTVIANRPNWEWSTSAAQVFGPYPHRPTSI